MAREDQREPKLKCPYYPEEVDVDYGYIMQTLEEKNISEYTGLDFNEMEELSFPMYLLYKRESLIYQCSKTEEGRKYLSKCWTIEQIEPDRKSLREIFGERR